MAQLDLFPTEICMKRVEPARNMWRFYVVRIEQTLFGEWCLLRRWGRIGTYGQEKIDWFADAGAAHDACFALTRKKQQRGYHLAPVHYWDTDSRYAFRRCLIGKVRPVSATRLQHAYGKVSCTGLRSSALGREIIAISGSDYLRPSVRFDSQ